MGREGNGVELVSHYYLGRIPILMPCFDVDTGKVDGMRAVSG